MIDVFSLHLPYQVVTFHWVELVGGNSVTRILKFSHELHLFSLNMSAHPLLNLKAPAFTLPGISGEDVTIAPGATGNPLV